MAGEVNVSIIALESLNSSLAQTVPMLYKAIEENKSSASQVLHKVDTLLDDYVARSSVAYSSYLQAVAELEYAERNYEDVPNFYYRAVVDAETSHQRLLECCQKIKCIRDDFLQQFNNVQEQFTQYMEDYSTMLNKGNNFVEKYIEVLNRSNSALSAGESSGGTSVSTRSDGVQSIQTISGWLGKINPNYNNPFTPKYRVNCGSCAFAVESRLNGTNVNAVASAKNIPTDAAMEKATGKQCIYMSVHDISNYLVSQGAGSHLIVGINRHPTPQGKPQSGHWFNAYYDGKQMYTIDGQSGRIYAWPHDYVDISAWCALI